MEKLKAIGVSDGIAISTIRVLERDDDIKEEKGQGVEFEENRLELALGKARGVLQTLKEKLSPEEGMIFEAHSMMLDDPELVDTIKAYITEGYSAEYATFRAKNDLKQIFLDMEDEYFRARANDVEDVLTRVTKILKNKIEEELDGEYILLSDELYPSETLELDFKKIKGFATLRGSKTSHTTILANNLKIPAIIGLESSDILKLDGKKAILDANIGLLIVDPEEQVLEEYRIKKENLQKRQKELQKYRDKPAITKSGKRIEVYANIGADIEAETAYQNGAEGIGLFRSEFLFLGRTNAPDEEEQFRAYKNAIAYMNGRPIIIRTMDIGADKQVDYLGLKEEDNPQMGLRAIRISLTRPELFKVQLRALLRAAYFGKLKVMLPMIISKEEILKTKELIEEAKQELEDKGIQYGEISLGIMIETPAAAISADELGKYVDFFSIGTNDLVSYTLAIDRTNVELENLRDDHHLAVLRLIEMTAKAAKKNKIDVGICGALGADKSLLDFYLEIGIDELSVSVGKVLEIKEAICLKD